MYRHRSLKSTLSIYRGSFFFKAVHGQPKSYGRRSSFDWIVKLFGVLENEKYDFIRICIKLRRMIFVCYIVTHYYRKKLKM